MAGFLPAAGAALAEVAVNKLFGGGNGAAKEARHYAWEQQQMAKENFYSGIQVRLADAKLAGVHPLAALGFNPGNTQAPTISASTDSGSSGLSGEVGQAAGRAVSSLFNSSERAMQKRMMETQLEGAELDNAYKRSQIAILNSTQQPPLPGGVVSSPFPHSSDATDPRYLPQAQMPMGYGDTAPLLRKGRDPNGDPIRVYNDDLGDNEVLQALSAIGISIPDLVANAGKRVGRWLREPRYSKKYQAPWSK